MSRNSVTAAGRKLQLGACIINLLLQKVPAKTPLTDQFQAIRIKNNYFHSLSTNLFPNSERKTTEIWISQNLKIKRTWKIWCCHRITCVFATKWLVWTLHVLSCSVLLKSVLLISFVFWGLFEDLEHKLETSSSPIWIPCCGTGRTVDMLADLLSLMHKYPSWKQKVQNTFPKQTNKQQQQQINPNQTIYLLSSHNYSILLLSLLQLLDLII